MDIRGGSLDRGRQMSVGGDVNGDFRFFRSLYLPKLRIQSINQSINFMATIIILYYVAPQWLFIDVETDDLEWSFIRRDVKLLLHSASTNPIIAHGKTSIKTLNGHFALKSGPSSASNGLAFWLSEKTIRRFAELYAYNCQRNKNVAQRLYWS